MPETPPAYSKLYWLSEYERETFCSWPILDLHVGHVGGEVEKNILSVLLWAPANVGEKHCHVCPERLVASQE